MAKKDSKLSPMMAQYFEVKSKYPDTILFFRVGDFYEMFFDDAKLASSELDLVLTGKDCGQEERAPMCGVPFHSADNYIAKLVSHGHKVAICEQTEDPSKATGLVKRDVIRVMTPGTVIESNMLDDGANNYLCAIYKNEDRTKAGLCFADISTGEFRITSLNTAPIQRQILNELYTYTPREIIVNNDGFDMSLIDSYTKRVDAHLEVVSADKFDYKTALKLINENLSAAEIEELNVSENEIAVCALGAVILYLKDTQKKDEIEAPSELEMYDSEKYMKLDMSARRNLELTKSMMTGDKRHSLLWVIDKTKTAAGKRMIRSWLERPLMSIAKITKRQNAIGELCDNPILRDEIRQALTGISDIERLLTRIVYSTANAKELKSLQSTLEKLPSIKARLADSSSYLLKAVYNDIDLLEDIRSLIDSAIVDEPPFTVREGGMIKEGFDKDIATANSHPAGDKDNFCGMTVKGVSFSEKKDAGEAIIAACKAMTSPDAIGFGSYRGFDMELSFDTFSKEYKITLIGELRHTVILGTDIFGNILRLDNAIGAFSERQIACKEQLDDTKVQLENAKAESQKPFPHEEELKTKSARLAELNTLLDMDKRDNELVDGERSDDAEEPDRSNSRDAR